MESDELSMKGKPDKTFAEKYGLANGEKVRISPEVEARVASMLREGKRIAEAGDDFARNCKMVFGK